jgi:hypothetical protein
MIIEQALPHRSTFVKPLERGVRSGDRPTTEADDHQCSKGIKLMPKGNTPATREEDQTPLQRFARELVMRAEVEENIDAEATGDELTAIQVERILAAETDDELFEAMEFGGLVGLKDVPDGTVLEIQSFRIVKGTDNKGKLGVYAAMQAKGQNGEERGYDTSVPRIIAFLVQCERKELLPVTVQIATRNTNSGNTMVSLRKVPAHVVRVMNQSPESPF